MRGLRSLMQCADKLSPILQRAWGTKTGVPQASSKDKPLDIDPCCKNLPAALSLCPSSC